MPDFFQSDSLTHAAADSIMSVSNQNLHKEKTQTIFSKSDFLKSEYILNYDSVHFKYTLDSAVIKAHGLDVKSQMTQNSNGFLGNSLPPMLKNQDGISLTLLLCFFLICKVIQRGYRFFFEGLRLLTFQEKKDVFNEVTIKEFWGNLFLILLPAYLLSLLAYQYFQYNDDVWRPPSHLWMTIVGFTLIIVSLLLVKYLFYELISYTFDIKEFVQKYLRSYFVLLELFGILIFVPVLVYIYAGNDQKIIILTVLILFLATRLILFSRLLAFFFNKRVNFLFGFAYLCTVEIIPYIILFLGFQFLYKEDIFCII